MIRVVDGGRSTVERAFELARSGACHSIDDIRRTLTRERYEGVTGHLAGQAIARQLKALIKIATENKA